MTRVVCILNLLVVFTDIDSIVVSIISDNCQSVCRTNCSHACFINQNIPSCACPNQWEPRDDTSCQPLTLSPCYNHQCSHSCYVNDQQQGNCACPTGYFLENDGLACAEKPKPENIWQKTDLFLKSAPGVWANRQQTHCMTVVPIFHKKWFFRRGVNLKLSECESNNPFQIFNYDPVTFTIFLDSHPKLCLSYRGRQRNLQFISAAKPELLPCKKLSSQKWEINATTGAVTNIKSPGKCVSFDQKTMEIKMASAKISRFRFKSFGRY